MRLLAIALGLAASAALLEVGCRLIWLRVESVWSERMGRSSFFYQRSVDPILGYELAPGFEFKTIPRYVRIGADGLRVTEGISRNAESAIGLLGDSVVFGIGHWQGETPADFLQKRLNASGDEAVRVVNFGVPGYSAREISEFFELKAAGRKLDAAVLVANLNDFSRRDSIYEGGDNGLYRMYVAPRWLPVYFLRKAVYRFHRNPPFVSDRGISPEWYRWLFAANREYWLAQIERMNSYASERGIRFEVVLFPSGQAYGPAGKYELEDIHQQIAQDLGRLGIRFADAAGAFRNNHDRLIDATDHPTVEGDRKLAEVIASLIDEQRSLDMRKAGARNTISTGTAGFSGRISSATFP